MGLISCPDCGKSVSDQATTCIQCGRPLQPTTAAGPAPASSTTAPSDSGPAAGSRRTLGSLLVLLGLVGFVFAYQLDTTVESGGEYLGYGISVPRTRVHNVGLMEERRNYFLLAGVAVLAGVIFVATSPRPSTPARSDGTLLGELESGAARCGRCGKPLTLATAKRFNTAWLCEEDYRSAIGM